MNLDRGLIKQQARALIKDKVMKLFITSFVVSIAIMAIGGLSFRLHPPHQTIYSTEAIILFPTTAIQTTKLF